MYGLEAHNLRLANLISVLQTSQLTVFLSDYSKLLISTLNEIEYFHTVYLIASY